MSSRSAVIALFAVFFFLTGCASVSTDTVPDVNLAPPKKIWVERRLADNHAVDELIVRRLQALGYDAGSGPLTMMPEGIQLILAYDDQWTWDFRNYMVQLIITVRDPVSLRLLASGRSFRPSITGRDRAQQMIDEVLEPIFRPDAGKR